MSACLAGSSFLHIYEHLTHLHEAVHLFSMQPLHTPKQTVFLCHFFFSPFRQSHRKQPIKTLPLLDTLHKRTCFLSCHFLSFPLLCDMAQGRWAKWLWQIGIGNDKIGYLIGMAEGIGLWYRVHSNKQTVWTPGPSFDGSFHPSDGETLAMEDGANGVSLLLVWMC